ncbi:MAG: ATP-binding cassette domain-containing protein [Lachnospiraceae bacterium]|nr:ATP-binding cassette domain-containing protein [Lachnospiraceae bacterium]MBR3580833.1 ATP-binding cassette domain-containing protein [Lachnospiraceae bacterium]MBR4541514.1 ATP-binding cassette domain-containing protein [Lachnospiraceae bacterium]
MSYIEVNNLRKTFTVRKKREKGKLFREKEIVEALKGISFVVEKGELVGYIGPNGAGKSTTVKILSGILTPESGDAAVGGRVPWKDRKEYVKHIGVVFGQRSQLWWDVPIVDSYSLLKDIYRIPEKEYKERLDELSEALQLEKLMRTPLRLLSLGQRMRAELCGSLLHRPELLFLDEPTIGLDAVSKLALRDFLKWENKEHGTTIMLTTHDMEDIAALCSRVMVLGHGRKLFDGKLPELLEKYDTVRTVAVRFSSEDITLSLPDGASMEKKDGEIKITYSPSDIPTADMLALLQNAGNISEMTLESQNLDHMIAAMYKEMDL